MKGTAFESGDMRIAEYLDRAASKEPTPGGGGVAGVIGAMAASLGEMVLAYSVGRKDLAQHEPRLNGCVRSVHAMRERLLELADADAKAYAVLNDAMKMDKSDPERKTALPKAALAAARVPLDVIRVISELMLCFEEMSGITNRWLRSDLAMATIFAEAVARASRWNIVMNIAFLDGMSYGLLDDADGLLERISAGASRTVEACG
ncbi:MAG: cyclodeaminase/cyclohydrolase family protein [Phycisphaerales bacterium]